MKFDALQKTTENIESDDEVAHLVEEYDFYAVAAAKHIEDLADPSVIDPFVITWTDGGSMENPAGYNDEFSAPNHESAYDALDACLAFIEEARAKTTAAGNEFHAAIFAHAYEVPDPEDDSAKWHILGITTFLHDLRYGAIFYQRFEPATDDGIVLIGGVQLGAKVANVINPA